MISTPTVPQTQPLDRVLTSPANPIDPPAFYSPEAYRALEETAVERHEYHNGVILPMSGGTEAHGRLAMTLGALLFFALRSTPYRVYSSDLRLWIPAFACGTYPDVMVLAGEPQFNEDRSDEVLNPLLIIEVLSPSTEAYDRVEKFRKYRSLPSFCEYVLVRQDGVAIEQYSKADSAASLSAVWLWQEHRDRSDILHLRSLNVDLSLAEIYDDFPALA